MDGNHGTAATDHGSPITDHGPQGRSCPAHYGYSPRVFARRPELVADTIYVIGGLYGNLPALDEIEKMAAAEPIRPQLVFNGDFHWFDASEPTFRQIQLRVLANTRHFALRGNVETEIASDNSEAGCGCAYPPSVPDNEVERSNAILDRLRELARSLCADADSTRRLLAELPTHAIALVGDARIAIVHGDAWSLAGWQFAHDALFDAGSQARLDEAFGLSAVDGFASTHTCLPALKRAAAAGRERFVVNNGAAGMPNFTGTRFGLITRISVRPIPAALDAARVYGADMAGVYVDAMAVNFDFDAWRAMFLEIWPAGSDAHLSYFERIVDGPAFTVDDALGRGPNRRCVALAA